jgi:DNA-binding MltR family transcriptional regulator
MAAAYLADQLERLLRQTFVDDKTAIDELFRPLAPLGSYSSRIELCYALGLLPGQAKRDLHLIRKIRNDFGHVAKTLTFDEPGITARCRELHYTGRIAEVPPRQHFTSAVMGVCAVVHSSIHKAPQRMGVPSDVTMTKERKRELQDFIEKVGPEVAREFGLSEDPSPEKSNA